MNFLRSRKVFIILMTGIFIILVSNISSYIYLYYHNLEVTNYFFRKTNFNIERNAPTIFSSCLHFIASVLMVNVTLSQLKIQKDNGFWWLMSFILLFTGMYELLVFHEKLGRAISEFNETSGLFFFAWLLPYMIGVLILVLLILKPLLRLPRETSINFIIGGGISILGAVGIEVFTGWYIENNNLDLTRLLVIPEIFILLTIEEFLKMAGMCFFIYSVLKFLEKYKAAARLETKRSRVIT